MSTPRGLVKTDFTAYNCLTYVRQHHRKRGSGTQPQEY